MAAATWSPNYQDLRDARSVEIEWQRALAARGEMDAKTWIEATTRLRETAAVLRDATLPIGSERARLEAIVDEMSTRLPERRAASR